MSTTANPVLKTVHHDNDNGSSWLGIAPVAAAPLAMPAQDLRCEPEQRHRRRIRTARQRWPARFVLLIVLGMTGYATWLFGVGLSEALALQNGGSIAHYLFLSLSVGTFAWIAFGAANAIVGAVAVLSNRGLDTLLPPPADTPLTTRTALLYPIYHEDPESVASGIAALATALAARGRADRFDVFVLSDSRTDEARARERVVFSELAAKLAPHTTLLYRNRERNEGKKAGNIADWVSTFGARYPHFIVFDADSVMTASTVIRLAAAMQSHPGTGLIQTVPRLIGAQTRFGLLQQFANNLFAPVSAAGFAAWQGTSGNYWGHNAIIRTRAFAACAGLPVLRGRAPFGGHIQSHDFVEAALLRRAGWRVALVTSLEGSFEGSPPTLFDIAVRDRRWMQGNLQHLKILLARGLAPISRLHLAVGIFAYLSSALWLTMIGTGLYLIWQEEQRVVRYFDADKSLFPNWPTFDPEAGLRVLAGTLLVVFLPKILGLGVALIRETGRRPVGLGVIPLIAGWFYEVAMSALMAPVYMLLQVRALGEILIGQDSGWKPQQRNGSAIPLGTTMQFHVVHVAVGATIGLFCASLSWYAFAWISPIVTGLVLSPLLTALTSREPGDWERSMLDPSPLGARQTEARSEIALMDRGPVATEHAAEPSGEADRLLARAG